MTFSLIGRCKNSGMFGIAITTSSICVGSRCPWARAGIGAVSTQNITLPSIGNSVLDHLQSGLSAEVALNKVISKQNYSDYRQVTVVDSKGQTAHFSGKRTLGINAVFSGDGCIASGNLLASEMLPATMVKSFEKNNTQHIGSRLLTGLSAGLYEAGGEVGKVHSAALIVVHEQNWPLVDLRCDWDDDDPLQVLESLWVKYKSQIDDYVARALNPSVAPSYGVPGDE